VGLPERRLPGTQKYFKADDKRGITGIITLLLHFALYRLTKWNYDSIIADGRTGDKQRFVTIDSGACVTITRLDIIAGLPKRKQSWPYVLQTASGETLPVSKEVLVALSLEQSG
jgi:hypothetical protein